MNEIKVVGRIRRENLDEINYVNSLIRSAYDNQMVTEEVVTDLQMQFLALLDERVARYNRLDSSSIRREILEEIAESNSYTISVYLKTFENPDDAIQELTDKGVLDAYQKGRKRLDQILDQIRVMSKLVRRNRLEVPNEFYQDTILGGIPGFLKIYNPDFKAQDSKITADYPLYHSWIGKLDGAEFIREYLNSLYLENLFCKKFSEEKIKSLLWGYAPNYDKLIFNIFEVVFWEAIACQFVRKNLQDLIITTSELNQIYEDLKEKDEKQIENRILEAYQEMTKELPLEQQGIKKYIERDWNTMINTIQNHLKQNTLEKIFITQKMISES